MHSKNPVLRPNMHPDKKKIFAELQTRFRGDDGEEKVLIPLLQIMTKQECGSVIHSHKTGFSLLQKTFENAVIKDKPKMSPDQIEFKMEVVLKLCEAIDVQLDVGEIEGKIKQKYFGKKKYPEQAIIKRILEIESSMSNLTKNEKRDFERDLDVLKQMLSENKNGKKPQNLLDPFNHLKLAHIRLQLNKNRKEHDVLVIVPKYKTVIQIEVKAIEPNTTEKVQVRETQNAINQLSGGCEEIKRIHGHVLDDDWSFIGVVALPNITIIEKTRICNLKKICSNCMQFVMVGDMEDELADLFCYHLSKEKKDWKASYARLIERLATYVHMAPSVTMEKITVESTNVLGGFSRTDYLPDLLTCSVSDLEAWKKSSQTGSLNAIMFLNKEQLSLWSEKRVAFIDDYGVGKTTLLKSRAMSFGCAGEKVLLVFIGAVNSLGQPTEIPSVMDGMNKGQFEQQNVKCVGAHDLLDFYHDKNKSWVRKYWTPQVFTLLMFYLKYTQAPNIFIDEAPIIRNNFRRAIHNALGCFLQHFDTALFHLTIKHYQIVCGTFICFLALFLLMPYNVFLNTFALFVVMFIVIPLMTPPTITEKESDMTANLLHSFSTEMPQKSTLWVAFHSGTFRERYLGIANLSDKSSKMKPFTIPSLRHNMRNTSDIFTAAEAPYQPLNIFMGPSTRMTGNIPPAAPPNLPVLDSNARNRRHIIPLTYFGSHMVEAVVFVYRHVLAWR